MFILYITSRYSHFKFFLSSLAKGNMNFCHHLVSIVHNQTNHGTDIETRPYKLSIVPERRGKRGDMPETLDKKLTVDCLDRSEEYPYTN